MQPQSILDYFADRNDAFPGLGDRIRAFLDAPSVPSASAMLGNFYDCRPAGDLEALQTIVGCFASKPVVLEIVERLLEDSDTLERVAAQSYPHPIGFDKLVLYRHREGPGAGFKLRLHLYWRSPQQIDMELRHLHRFEMASAPVTGELTNHLWRVVGFQTAGPGLPLLACRERIGERALETMYAYSGFQRDPDGSLHKRYLGEAQLQKVGTQTFVPGQVYSQLLEDVHYVETNSETGHTNGDFCSTIYVHGPSLQDATGRRIPVLMEEQRLADDDTTVGQIPNLVPAKLHESLQRYAVVLRESIAYYQWLYDPKYGRNLSVGMIAGYLLSEILDNPNTIDLWNQRYPTCRRVLDECSSHLGRLIDGSSQLGEMDDADRTRRYYGQLLSKADTHASGRAVWFGEYGNLRKEMWRYLGALLGDYARNPDTRVLKPVWELNNQWLAGGAHYGTISAMLEAGYRASDLMEDRFRARGPEQRAWLNVTEKGEEGPVSAMDHQVQDTVEAALAEHFPEIAFVGEEAAQSPVAAEAQQRWLVDPLDGTRNFLAGNKNFAVSIARQRRSATGWTTEDAVLALPAHREVYWAERGGGAYLIDRDGDEVRLRIADVGETPEAPRGGLIDLSIRGLGPAAERLTARLSEVGMVGRRLGSAAIALAMVSGTGHHAAIQTAASYDVVAGMLIAREAGAVTAAVDFARAGRQFTAHIAAQSQSLCDLLVESVCEALAASGIQPLTPPSCADS